jgi:small-conductance mechanosensitive channel
MNLRAGEEIIFRVVSGYTPAATVVAGNAAGAVAGWALGGVAAVIVAAIIVAAAKT